MDNLWITFSNYVREKIIAQIMYHRTEVCQYKGDQNKANLLEWLSSYLTLPTSNIMSKYGARARFSRCKASILQNLDLGARRCSQEE